MGERTFQRWLVVGVVLALALAGYFVWHAPRSVPPEEGAPEVSPAPRGPPAFARWLRFEPESLRSNPALADTYIDAILGHQVFRLPPRGVHPQIGRQLLLDDDKLLLSSGRHLWTRELAHQPGLAAAFCSAHPPYWGRRPFPARFRV